MAQCGAQEMRTRAVAGAGMKGCVPTGTRARAPCQGTAMRAWRCSTAAAVRCSAGEAWSLQVSAKLYLLGRA